MEQDTEDKQCDIYAPLHLTLRPSNTKSANCIQKAITDKFHQHAQRGVTEELFFDLNYEEVTVIGTKKSCSAVVVVVLGWGYVFGSKGDEGK